MLKDTVKALSSLYGISGREESVREYIISQIEGTADYRVDNLGNLIVFKKGAKTPKNKVMLDAHMDEVGMVATYITSDGLIRFTTAGGINTKALIGKNVLVGEKKVNGVIGIVPIHLVDDGDRRKIPEKESLYVDIGASDADEAGEYVKPGDAIYFDSDYVEFGDGFIKGRALDDRVGCAILLEMLKSDLPFDMYFSFSVQEEVGTRGAAASAFSVNPDYAVAVETTTASDIPGVEGEKQVCRLGGGAVVSFMDRGTVYNHELFTRAFELAEEKNIKMQTKTMVAGGNNAAAIHKSAGGVKVLTVSVPCRYLHSPACVIKWEDVEESSRAVMALAEEFADA